MIFNDLYRRLARRADLTAEEDLDRLWGTIVEMVPPATASPTEQLEKGVLRCYCARTRLVRTLTDREEAALHPRAVDQVDTPHVPAPLKIHRREDLLPEHLEPYGLRAARRLAVELDIPEEWITDLRARLTRERRTEQKRAASEQRKAKNASVS